MRLTTNIDFWCDLMAWAVEVEGLWKLLGDRWVLKDVSLRIGEGELVGVSGPNGSGKSTLLRIISGVWRPSRGFVRVFGFPSHSPLAKRFVGCVFHENILYDELTVWENLSFFARVRGVDKDFLGRVLDVLGLRRVLGVRVGSLSFGWRRRANFAVALMSRPRVFLVDEPFTGQDDFGRRAVRRLVDLVLGYGGTVVVASPFLEDLFSFGGNVTVYGISGGRIVGGR